MDQIIGQVFGDYRIEALLGAGSQAEVYRARHLRLDRPAAVRIFRPELVASPGFQARFAAAARTAAALRHPNVVELFDVGEHAGRPYMVTELMEAGSLRELLLRQPAPRTPLAPTLALDLARQAAEGLSYIHAQGVVHGNIKPENLLLNRLGLQAPDASRFALKVGDVALAQLADPAAGPVGTPAYLSPEQCRGEALDGRSDLYSLGVVLYELSTGYVPFAVTTLQEATTRHTQVQPTPPRAVRPDLPVALETIILRCLAKRPEDRFSSAGDLARELGGVLRTAATVQLSTPPQEAQTQAVARPAPAPGGTPTPSVQVFDAGGRAIRTVALQTAGLRVGRDPGSDLVLDDPAVSRDHARIDWNGAQAAVTDLDSRNGTVLGTTRLQPNVPEPWPWDTPLQLGPFRLQLRRPDAGGATVVDPLLANLLGSQAAQPQATAAVSGGRIAVRLEQEQLTLTPGQSAVLRLTVVNNAPSADYVTITVEGVPGSWIRGPEQSLQVPARGQAGAALTVVVPRTYESRAGDYPVIVRARSGSNQAESGTARGRWTVLPFAAGALTLAPRSISTSGEGRYQVTVRNEGNAAAGYLLSFVEDEARLGYKFSEDEIRLEPGEAATVALDVWAERRWIGSPETSGFEVWAESVDDQVRKASAQFVQQPALSPMALLLGLGALALLAALAYFLFGGPPGGTAVVGTTTPSPEASATPTALPTSSPTPVPGAPIVLRFSVAPEVVAPGEPVTVSWEVQDADRVFIDVFGDVPLVGERTYRPESTTRIELNATRGELTTTSIQQAVVAVPTAAPTATTVAPTAAATATAVPPTAVPPTAVPPTAVPPTAVPPTPAPIDLLQAAPNAQWLTDGGPISFGPPASDTVAFADDVSEVILEDTSPHEAALAMAPPPTADGFVEGRFSLPPIAERQAFLAQVGFAERAPREEVTIQVSFDGEVLFNGAKRVNNRLLTMQVDLGRFAGRSGQLVLRVGSRVDGVRQVLYWVEPRVAVP